MINEILHRSTSRYGIEFRFQLHGLSANDIKQVTGIDIYTIDGAFSVILICENITRWWKNAFRVAVRRDAHRCGRLCHR